MTTAQADQIIVLLQNMHTTLAWILGFTVGLWVIGMMKRN